MTIYITCAYLDLNVSLGVWFGTCVWKAYAWLSLWGFSSMYRLILCASESMCVCVCVCVCVCTLIPLFSPGLDRKCQQVKAIRAQSRPFIHLALVLCVCVCVCVCVCAHTSVWSVLVKEHLCCTFHTLGVHTHARTHTHTHTTRRVYKSYFCTKGKLFVRQNVNWILWFCPHINVLVR